MNILTVLLFCLSIFVRQESNSLEIEVLHRPETCDRVTKVNDFVQVHYTGTLENGKKFDSSWDRDAPLDFQLGARQVIQGWEEGLLDMCVGEKRRLVVPPEQGYGDQEMGDLIPPGSTLLFETELVNIMDSPPQRNVFAEVDTNEDQLLSKEEIPEASRTEHDPDKIVEEVFQQEDKDRDGHLSYEEFTGPKHEEL